MFRHAFRWKQKCELVSFLIVFFLCCLNVSLAEFARKNKFNLYTKKQVNSNINNARSDDHIDVHTKSRKSHDCTNNLAKYFANGRDVKIEGKNGGCNCETNYQSEVVEQVNDLNFINRCAISVNCFKRQENFAEIRVKREVGHSPTHEKKEAIEIPTTATTDVYHDSFTLLLGKLWFDRPLTRKKRNHTANRFFQLMFNTTRAINLTTGIHHDTTTKSSDLAVEKKATEPANYPEDWLTTQSDERPWIYNEKELYIRYSTPKYNHSRPSWDLSPHKTAYSFTFENTPRNTLYDNAIKMKLGHLWFDKKVKRRRVRLPTEDLEHYLTTRPEERPWIYNEKELYIRYSTAKYNYSRPLWDLSPHKTAYSFTFANTPRDTLYDNATILKLGHLWFDSYLSKYIKTTTTTPKRKTFHDPSRWYTRPTSNLLWKKVYLGHLWFNSNESDDSNDPNFFSKYYDPKGFHGQETHPIYGRYGSRFITKVPRTPEPDISGVRVKIYTRGPNETLRFTVTYDSEEFRKWQSAVKTETYTEPTDISDDSKFWEKYYDPKGYHGQETHPIYGRYGSRLITKWPRTPEPEDSGVWFAEFTRGPNETLGFTITTSSEVESTNAMKKSKTLGPNSKKRRRKTQKTTTTEKSFEFTDPTDISDDSKFWEKYYDPKGFHGQETHPIYGRYGSRLITRWSRTPEPDESCVRVKIFTRAPNATLGFSITTGTDEPTTTSEPEPTPEYESVIDSDDSKFYEKHYDPRGFHGQETHPIYGRYGSRFISKKPLTTEPWDFVRVKTWTRNPNETLRFTITTSAEKTDDISYYSDESEPNKNHTRVRRSIMDDVPCDIYANVPRGEKLSLSCHCSIQSCAKKIRCKRFAIGVTGEQNRTIHLTTQKSPQTLASLSSIQTLVNKTLTSLFKNQSTVSRKFRNRTGIYTKKTYTFRTKAKTTVFKKKSLMTFNYSYFTQTFTPSRADWRFQGLPHWIWHYDKRNTTIPDYIYEQNVSFDTRENLAYGNVSDKDFVWLNNEGTQNFEDYRIDMENLPPGMWQAKTGDMVEYPIYITFTTPEGYSHTTPDYAITYDMEEVVKAFWERKKNETTYEGFIPPEECRKWWSERENKWRTDIRIYYTTKPKTPKPNTTKPTSSGSNASKQSTTIPTTSGSNTSKQSSTKPTTFSSNPTNKKYNTTRTFTKSSHIEIEKHLRKKRSVIHHPLATNSTSSNVTTTDSTTMKELYRRMMSKFSLGPEHFSYKLPKFVVPTEGKTMGPFYTGEHVDWKWVEEHFGTVANRTYATPDSVERAWEQIKWSDENETTIHRYYSHGYTDYPLVEPDEFDGMTAPTRDKRSIINRNPHPEINPSSTSYPNINATASTSDSTTINALYRKMMSKFSLGPEHFSYKLPKFVVPTEGKTMGPFYTGEHVDWKWVEEHFGTVANRTYATPDSVERAWEQIKWSDENDTTIHPYYRHGYTDYPLVDPDEFDGMTAPTRDKRSIKL